MTKFNVTGPIGDNALAVDSNGNTFIKKLLLLDEKTGNKWELKVSDGQIFLEPFELEDKREMKLDKILK